MLSFAVPKSFKTIIISSKNLEDGIYTLYYGSDTKDNYGIITNNSTRDNQISADAVTEFIVSKIVNYYDIKY